MEILAELTGTIAAPREELSQYAPKIEMMQIKPDKIKVVIGKGGDTINSIIEETGVKIDIDQEGNVSIASADTAMIARAKQIIEELTHEVKVGEIYEGTVKRIEKFGAFVGITKGKDGMVHISELANERVKEVEDVLAIGDKVKVKVIEIDRQGRINLSRKALLPKEEKQTAQNRIILYGKNRHDLQKKRLSVLFVYNQESTQFLRQSNVPDRKESVSRLSLIHI
eukprot:TRINITY_DN22326_c0_g1_i1.p1 TRINITY_DN22326_c0_g1~~TRINITY_DN22326_c0_g1_i1.p1  ORF type:complete len:225 (+),score=13.72 TRINITY_DN22326_c0_g1_i1:226-900(+)